MSSIVSKNKGRKPEIKYRKKSGKKSTDMWRLKVLQLKTMEP